MKASDSITRTPYVGMGSVGAVFMVGGIAATMHMGMTSIPVHHLLHAGMTLGAGCWRSLWLPDFRRDTPNAVCGLSR